MRGCHRWQCGLAALVAVALMLGPAPAPASRSSIVRSSGPNSPTSGLLVFGCEGCPGSDSGLYTISPDGRGFRVMKGTAGASAPRWSPDGRSLVFAKDGAAWLSSSDGSNRRLVARASGSPAWSPSGDQLAFSRSSGIYTTGVKAIRPRPLLRLSAKSARFVDPDWSPNGKTIIGWRGVEIPHLWMIDADGSHLHRIGPTSLLGQQPRWSSDGHSVAFVDFDSGTVNILTLKTGRIRTIFEGSIEGDQSWAIAWSPDGRRLAVAGWTDYVQGCDDPVETCRKPGLWIVSAATARSKLILSFPGDSAFIEGLDWKAR